MKMLRTIWLRIRARWQRCEVKQEIDEELRFRIAQRTAEYIAAGMTPEAAACAARERLSHVQSVREECSETRGTVFGETLLQDIRFGLRMLRKSPGFTVVAVLSLALGIGATTAIVSLMKGIVLDPLPYPAANRLVNIWGCDRGENLLMRDKRPLSAPVYFEIREQAASFEEVGAASETRRFNLGGDHPELVPGVACTASLLQTLGVQPALGRCFTDAENQPGADQVVIISQGLWRRTFAADPRIIGQTIRLNGQSLTVVGVMPAGFLFSTAPWETQPAYDLWIPLVLNRGEAFRNGGNNLLLTGRLKPGVTPQIADAELKTIAARLTRAHPEMDARGTFRQIPLATDMTSGPVTHLIWLLSAVWIVLTLACQNVAGMLLAKGITRQTEMAVRVALGASRWRIIRLMLAESLVLSLIASAFGLLLVLWAMQTLTGFLPPGLVPRGGIQIDGWMLLFSLGLAAVTALMSGFMPATIAAKTDLMSVVKEGGGNQSASQTSQRRLRRLLIVRIASALVLVNAAILLSTSYRGLLRTHRTLATDQVLTAEITLNGQNFGEPRAREAFVEKLFERVRPLPGVKDAAVTTKLPFEWGSFFTALRDGESYDPKATRHYSTRNQFSTISSAYFSVMGIPLLKGRNLEETDARPGLSQNQNVVINRTMAERFWPGEDPLGKRLRDNNATPGWSAIVVGVVDDVRQRVDTPARPEMYFPYAWLPDSKTKLVVRSQGDSRILATALQREVARLDPDLALGNVRTMKELVESNTQRLHFLTLIVDIFVAIALGLVAIGIYGTLSFHVAQRSREFAVRVTLGADRRAILQIVFGQAARWVGAGVVAGLAFTIGLASILRAMVTGLSLLDSFSLLAGVSIVVATSLVACWLPVHRAAKVDPMTALRTE